VFYYKIIETHQSEMHPSPTKLASHNFVWWLRRRNSHFSMPYCGQNWFEALARKEFLTTEYLRTEDVLDNILQKSKSPYSGRFSIKLGWTLLPPWGGNSARPTLDINLAVFVKQIIHVTIRPFFAGFHRFHHRVFCRMKMLRGMFVL